MNANDRKELQRVIEFINIELSINWPLTSNAAA